MDTKCAIFLLSCNNLGGNNACMKDDGLDRLMDLREVAEATGRSKRWWQTMCRTGRLPCTRSGDSPNSKYLVTVADVRRLVNPQRSP